MTVREAWRAGRTHGARVLAVVRRIVGVPDYDAYLAHARRHHPDAEPLSREAFVRESWDAKYSRPGNRCC
jgi:uncharacterized short protein YbdD (DUF466 family)